MPPYLAGDCRCRRRHRFHPAGRQLAGFGLVPPADGVAATATAAARHNAPHSLDVHDFFERLAELRIEDGVDDRVDEAVHVAQPGRQDECRHARLAGHVELGAHRVHDVAGEERYPAD